MDNSQTVNTNLSILKDVGENYHYAKTIMNHKLEIFKLELLQHISMLGNVIIGAVLVLLFAMILISLFIAALVIFLAQIFNSYLYAILLSIGIMIVVSFIAFIILKARIMNFIEKKLIALI